MILHSVLVCYLRFWVVSLLLPDCVLGVFGGYVYFSVILLACDFDCLVGNLFACIGLVVLFWFDLRCLVVLML